MDKFSDTQLSVIFGFIGTAIGGAVAIVVRWIEKRKSPNEEKNDQMAQLTKSTSELVGSAKEISDMWERLMQKQTDNYEKSLTQAIASAKEECRNQINELKNQYQDEIGNLNEKIMKMQTEKDATDEKVVVLESEKERLTTEVEKLKKENIDLSRQLADLTARLRKYEKIGTGPLVAKNE